MREFGMKRKIRVGVVFWWKICRARNFSFVCKKHLRGARPKKYEPLLIGIDKNGEGMCATAALIFQTQTMLKK